MWLRGDESALASVTAGNGAIYALRREAYMHVDAVMGHDLSFPFNVVKRGRRAVYAPGRARDGEDGALDRGRGRAQAAHDEPRLGDRPARRDALPARLPAAVRADDRLAPRAALRVAAAAPRRGRRDARAAAPRPRLPRRGARPGRPARGGRGGRHACVCGRRSSRATTSRRRPRSAPGSTTTCATARPRCGRPRRARGELPRQARARRRRSRRWCSPPARRRSRSPRC